MRLFLNERPRTFVITSGDHALIVRHPYPTSKKDQAHHHMRHLHSQTAKTSGESFLSKVIVEFVTTEMVDLSKFQELTDSHELEGLLGLFNMKGNVYLSFITKSTVVATPRLGENIYRIDSVEFYCLNTDEFDHFLEADYSNLHLNKKRAEYPAASVRKFLCNGDFFYSLDFDITSNLQERGFSEFESTTTDIHHQKESGFKLYADSPYFQRFMWNTFLNSELIQFRSRLTPYEVAKFDKAGFLVTITRGYAKTLNVSLSNGEDDALLTLVNKQSCVKDGPLFGEWGADDKGAVSNYQESEIIIFTPKFCFSYTIVKGNVPIFWEVESHFSKSSFISKSSGKKITFPRSFETSHHVFKKHMDRLIGQYGDIHLISSIPLDNQSFKSVLGDESMKHIEYFNRQMTRAARSEKNENGLNDELIYTLTSTNVPLKTSAIKKNGYTGANPYKLISNIIDPMIGFGALFYDLTSRSFIGKQLGIFRITTYDSLSKANFISKVICQEVIELAFKDIGINVTDDLLNKHAKLWQECDEFINKNIVSFISYSTKLKESSATSTKKNIKSKVSKKYLNSVIDSKVDEKALLKLLGRLQDQMIVSIHNPIHDYIIKELQKRSKLYTSTREIDLFTSTFNINGTIYKGDIKDWLFPEKFQSDKSYDVVLIGIQEIIELSASKIVNIDYEVRRHWENHIKWHLNEFNPEKVKYLSLWSGQLGGLALFIYIKSTEISKISQVESSFKKTGFGGVGANKGGIAVRFDYENTEICFVSSHLAAGLTNVVERHHDYKVISKGAKFSRNRRIKDHDVVVWLGDLNYRINLSNEQTKMLIDQQNYSKLSEFDQLNTQMANGESFPFFNESELKFPPTYKFDKHTTIYDTSEKQRIPAWTDRILYMSRSHLIKPIFYDSVSDIIFSDHRPVVGEFKLVINIENETIKKQLRTEIYNNYIKNFGEINDLFINSTNLSYLFDLDKNLLPPPSSDTKKWWLNGGKAAKITIPDLSKPDTAINPKLPINPFSLTVEPEFVLKSEI